MLGQTRSLVDSCAFAQQEDGTISAIWSDDLVGSGYRANMEVMKEKLHEALECNTGELVGVGADLAKEATFTKRTIRCIPDAGWELEADTKHVKALLQWFECEEARGSPVPGSKDARRPLEQETETDGTTIVLDQEERAEYRKHVGLLQYIANDRFDLKYAVKEVRRDAAQPTVVSRRMVKKIVRDLRSVPRAVLCFGWSERGDTVVVTVDADHAGCSETRRSTSSGVIQVNDHVLSEWSTTQSTVALSSGESEFVAIVKGVVMGLFTRNLLNELGWCITQVVIRSDSSAGRGMASRLGVGRRSKHLETKSLFAQHLIKDGLVVLEPVHTKLNTADIGTKYLDAPTMRRLIGLLGVRLLTLDGAEARRCEDAQQVQDDGRFVFVWTAVVTAVIILVTVWIKCRNCYVVHTETLTEDVNEINKEVDECETQKPIEIVGDVWINCVPTFLTADETLRLRAAAVPFNTENLCGEYGPLLFFLFKHMMEEN